jgi:hypothetical protein
MLNKCGKKLFLWLLIVVVALTIGGCSQPPEEPVSKKKEEPPVIPALPPENTAIADQKQLQKLPPPKSGEVQDAVTRVFKNAVTLDSNHNPYFLVGDFNGDYSQDIAVVIKPVAGKLSELNQEYPPWILKDPFHPNLPPQVRTKPLQVELHDVLLAVIHGFGSDGWRNSEATQTYILKDAVGNAIQAKPAKALLAANSGKKLPKLFGDTIAQSIEGTSGFLYYTGAGYAWYDPKTFQPGTDQRVAHAGMTAQK